MFSVQAYVENQSTGSMRAPSARYACGNNGFSGDSDSNGIAILVVVKICGLKSHAVFLKDATLTDVKRAAIEYRKFPLVSVWGALANTVAIQLPVFVISYWYAVVEAGYYILTYKVVSLPLFMISAALSDVLHSKMVRVDRETPWKLRRLVVKVFVILLACVTPVVFLMFFFSENIFSIVFGREWGTAGMYAAILVFPIAVRFAVVPLSVAMLIDKNVKTGTQWQIVYLISLSITLYLCKSLDVVTLIKIYALHDVVLYVMYFVVIFRCTKYS